MAVAVHVAMCVLLPRPAVADERAVPQWVLPMAESASVVRGFDPPSQPWSAGHRGVDLAAPAGATVRAAGAGVVSYAGLLAGRSVVAISHGELRTTYEPVTATVSVGEQVDRGEPIGALATAGGHCLPSVCLHWGLLRGKTYLDPLQLLGGRVRLLPLGSEALRPLGAPPPERVRSAARPHRGPAVSAPDPPPGRSPPVGPLLAAAAVLGAR
jgi:murein DD-endopeptidase MepM/ murein hydrolase activator NlpD